MSNTLHPIFRAWCAQAIIAVSQSKWVCAVIIANLVASTAIAQGTHYTLRVDIQNGSTSGDGSGWDSNAHKFLQDALTRADILMTEVDDTAEIWVAAAFDGNDEPIRYRPDQGTNYTLGDREHAFELRNNVAIFGGFPPDPHDYNGNPATFEDRNPALYETILSGDLDGDDIRGHIVRAINVNSTAVLDGFTIEGGLDIRSAQPRFRDCQFQLHEGAAVRCADGSMVAMYRSAFPAMPCHGIQITHKSRLVLIDCDAEYWQGDGHVTVSPCSSIWVSARDGDAAKKQILH